MTDPIDAAAAEIKGTCGYNHEPRDHERIIAKILRRHLPSWKPKPDRAGWWIAYSGEGELFAFNITENQIKGTHKSWKKWYGPIPEPTKGCK